MPSDSAVAAFLLLVFSLLAFLCINNLSRLESRLVRSVRDDERDVKAHERFVYEAAERQNTSGFAARSDKAAISGDSECTTAPEARFDCGRDRTLTRGECEERGCCYAPLPGSGGPPWCFYPRSYPGYTMGPLSPTTRGQRATLTRKRPSYLPKDIRSLRMEVTEESTGCLHLSLKDASSQRYEVHLPGGAPEIEADDQSVLYAAEFQPDPFGFIVRRRSNGRVIMNTTVAPLLFSDQYLQLSTSLASSLVSGLGEHYTSILLDLNWTSLTLWNRDMAPHADANLYGSHPFYLVQEEDGFAHGVFLLNSNAIEVALQPTPALTWVSTGGILDLYIFLGPDPQSVVRQYLHIIGYPMMPPYWSLGFHLCRWGYTTSNTTRRVAQRMHDASFPLDVQWNDLDYADKRRVFTFDRWRFGDLPEMVDEFHQRGMKYILILDPGISSSSAPGTYPPFDDGVKRDVFIKNATGHILIGKRSMDSGTVPQLWKHSIVIPIPKKSIIRTLNDLRPVALTSLVMKAMERVIKQHIVAATDTLMDPLQFAYRTGRGVDDAKAFIIDTVHKHLEQPDTSARLLFADFSSAFNTMQPHILADKLTSCFHLDLLPQLLSTGPQDTAADVVWAGGGVLSGPPEGSHHLSGFKDE